MADSIRRLIESEVEGEEMKRPLIASPPWTVEEEARLRVLLNSGEHPAIIGRQLQRTEGAIRHRMTKLGLRPKRGKRTSITLSPTGRMRALKDSVSAGWIDLKAKGK